MKMKNGWNLMVSGSSVVYVTNVDADFKSNFVARFKYLKPKSSANKFVKFLMDNFSPAEYFAEYAKGKTPLVILMEKGFKS